MFYHDDYAMPARVASLVTSEAHPTFLDLGANIGTFVAAIQRQHPGVRVVAFEPDPANAEILRQTVARNKWSSVTVHEVAAGASAGSIPFLQGRFTGSRRTLPGEHSATEVVMQDVMPLLADTTVAKIDIEGGEWEILTDRRFGELGPQSLIVEYHPEHCPTDDPRQLVVSLLEHAGYDVLTPAHEGGDLYGLVWGLRRARTSLEGA